MSKERQLHVLINNGGIMAPPVELLALSPRTGMTCSLELMFSVCPPPVSPQMEGRLLVCRPFLPDKITTSSSALDGQILASWHCPCRECVFRGASLCRPQRQHLPGWADETKNGTE